MWEFLDANSAAITAITTVVLTATTIVYACLTRVLAQENRLLRKAGSAPQVVAYLAQHAYTRQAIDFVLANVGRGPALHVSYTIVSGGDDLREHVPEALRGVSENHAGYYAAFSLTNLEGEVPASQGVVEGVEFSRSIQTVPLDLACFR